jgi:hypothetical protein
MQDVFQISLKLGTLAGVHFHRPQETWEINDGMQGEFELDFTENEKINCNCF